ncbi:MAG: colicin M resistance protein CbrA [Firmicutes bacterium HGW-Firmicutes-16]|nr:MAG: colicin M resistance protein CbrA [Firmicutes bacterium HGW-Firmicutes-16]
MDYDIIIIGLGPAGATIAKLLPPSLRVCAIDKKSLKGEGFKKVCGGLLAPDAQKFFASLNLTLPKDVLVDPQIFSVRAIDLDSGLTRYYQRFYMNLDRDKFDKWLISQITDAVTTKSDCCCTEIQRVKGGFTVQYREQDGNVSCITSRYIVGADGAGSIVRRKLFSGHEIRRYTAIQQWFEDTHTTPFYSSVFDSRATDCYSWSLSKDGKFIFGGAYPPKNCRESFESQKAALTKQGFKFGQPLKTEACIVYRPSKYRDFRTAKNGAFLVGEAAGFISPSSLEGISYAMKTGYMLSEVFGKHPEHPERFYRKKVFGVKFALMLKIIKCPFIYNRFLRGIIMKSGITAIDILEQ